MDTEITNLPFSFITIKTTKSRIEKGLIAIPTSLISLFPQNTKKICITDDMGKEEMKTFTPYLQKSRECRIGGMKSFYQKHAIKDGDELVLQFLDKGKFKIIPEKFFHQMVQANLQDLEQSADEAKFTDALNRICKIANIDKEVFLVNEFVRRSNLPIEPRKKQQMQAKTNKETVPYALRKILLNLYKGKCQISNFSFLTKNKLPYFELHHVYPDLGNHPKNLIVVSPNIHAMFTHAHVKHSFDKQGWLRQVKFNSIPFEVYQKIDELPAFFKKETHY